MRAIADILDRNRKTASRQFLPEFDQALSGSRSERCCFLLSAPADQAHRADAGGEQWERRRERRGRSDRRSVCNAVAEENRKIRRTEPRLIQVDEKLGVKGCRRGLIR